MKLKRLAVNSMAPRSTMAESLRKRPTATDAIDYVMPDVRVGGRRPWGRDQYDR